MISTDWRSLDILESADSVWTVLDIDAKVEASDSAEEILVIDALASALVGSPR